MGHWDLGIGNSAGGMRAAAARIPPAGLFLRDSVESGQGRVRPDLEVLDGIAHRVLGDLLVEESVVVELKAVELILPIHISQLLTYLKLSGHRLGLLINFNVTRIKDGIKRLAL